MPDENTNPVWTTQTSQDDQALTNQQWDDFVLNFWEEENDDQNIQSEVKVDDLKDEEWQGEDMRNEAFDSNIFDDKESTNDSESNNEIQDENVNNEESVTDFDISLDNNEWMGEEEWTWEEWTWEEWKEEWEEEEWTWEEWTWEEWEEEWKEEEWTWEDFNISLDENTSEENKEVGNDEMFLSNDGESVWEIDENNEVGIGSNEWEDLQTEQNNEFDNLEEKSEDNSNLLEDSSTNINTAEEPLNQPEIGDLLWNSSIDFSEQDNIANETEENENWNLNQEQDNLQGNKDFIPENGEETNITDTNEDLSNNNMEDQSFTLDYTNGQENITEEASNENINWTNIEVTNTEPNESSMNIDTNQIESTNQVQSQQISTLSLDQILDTELNNNPQFTDNSKAVPINISTNTWFFNKKMIWIVAWIWLFLLAGVAVVFYSSWTSDKKPENTVDTGQIVEEYIDDHQVAESIDDLEENYSIDWSLEEDSQWDISIRESNVTVQQDFPDVDWEEEDNYLWDDGFWDVEPYVSDRDDYSNEWNVDQPEELEIWNILPVISDYKSQAETYYSQWDEMQDKKLIKYSLQAIHLCDDYQEQIQNGESLDEGSFSSFKSKIEKILTKMEEYLGGDSYNDFSQNNDYYDF